MAYRKKLSRNKSSRSFRRGAGTQSINLTPNPMRGGYRF